MLVAIAVCAGFVRIVGIPVVLALGCPREYSSELEREL